MALGVECVVDGSHERPEALI
jgi:hypothetical protein